MVVKNWQANKHMEQIGNFFIDTTMKCWACPIFDNLFVIISNAAGKMYKQLTVFGVIIFCILFSFFVINAIWENIKSKEPDNFFKKSIKPVVIKALIALSLLGMGLQVPRLISKITFEPVAAVTLEFSKVMIPTDYQTTKDYQKIELKNDGFFTPKLRDTILDLIQTSVTNFQVYVKIGLSIMDSAFSLKSLIYIGSLVKHILVFFIGALLTYSFVRLFIKYSFCFMDIIIAMAMFAFFFPLSIIFFIFKGADNLPGWMKSFGGDLGSGQIKSLINAIVSVAAAILGYTIIMMIIRGYLNSNGVDINAFHANIETLFDFDLENSNAMQITFAGSIVLVYVIRYIADEIPKITNKILETFNLSMNDSASKEMGENMLKLTTVVAKEAKEIASAIINPEAASKKEEKKK